MRNCRIRDLGRMSYGEALGIQHEIAAARKQGAGTDHLLFVEHPHVITMGRNGHEENLLAPEAVLRQKGVTEETILAAVRIASVIHGAAAVLDAESALKEATALAV